MSYGRQRLKENEGLHIEDNERTIDVILRNIVGHRMNREGSFEVRGADPIKDFRLYQSRPNMNKIPGVRLSMIFDYKSRGNTVNMSYNVNKGITVIKQNYKPISSDSE